MKRRKFLKLSSMGSTGFMFAPFLNSQSKDKEKEMYSSPQMVGEVSQTSTILQTRLAVRKSMPEGSFDSPAALLSQDIAGAKAIARFEIADNAHFNGAQKTPWKQATTAHDFIVKHRLQGLKAGTQYYMRVRFGASKAETKTGPVSRFKTLPSRDSESEISFVISSCMNLGKFFLGGFQRAANKGKSAKSQNRKLGYLALEIIENLQPDFWVQTGDNVYYDWPRNKKEYRAKTKTEMRAKWHRQMGMPRMLSLLQQVPVYWMIDDHDYRYNDSDNCHNDERPSPALAKNVFCEQVPITGENQAIDDIHRTRRVNKHLQIWTLDGRFHRDDNTKPDGPDKSMWGEKQYKWLKKTLLSSTATFKLLIVGSPLIGPDDAQKHDNHTDYGGFQHERDQFFQWLKKHNFSNKNFYIITGDRHWQYHSIHPSGFEEFGTGTLTEQNSRYGRKPGDPDSTDPLGLITQPYIQEQPTAGFISVRVAPPGKDRPALLTFTTLDKNGNELYVNTKRAT